MYVLLIERDIPGLCDAGAVVVLSGGCTPDTGDWVATASSEEVRLARYRGQVFSHCVTAII